LSILVDETGLAKRTLQYIAAQEPSGLPDRDGKRGREFQQPDCSINLRNREFERGKEEAKRSAAVVDTGRTRHESARAELAELELAERRAQLVTVDGAEMWFASACHRVRARLIGLPSRLAPAILGARSVPEALARIEPLIHEVIEELRKGDDVPRPTAANSTA